MKCNLDNHDDHHMIVFETIVVVLFDIDPILIVANIVSDDEIYVLSVFFNSIDEK